MINDDAHYFYGVAWKPDGTYALNCWTINSLSARAKLAEETPAIRQLHLYKAMAA
jgi:hypothetical protein